MGIEKTFVKFTLLEPFGRSDPKILITSEMKQLEWMHRAMKIPSLGKRKESGASRLEVHQLERDRS